MGNSMCVNGSSQRQLGLSITPPRAAAGGGLSVKSYNIHSTKESTHIKQIPGFHRTMCVTQPVDDMSKLVSV